MERNTAFTCAGAILAGAALVFAVVTGVKVNSIKESISFDTSVKVAVAGVEKNITDEQETAAEPGTVSGTASVGNETVETQTGAEKNEADGEMNIILHDGSLRLLNSWIRVPNVNVEGNAQDLYVYLNGENSVKYNSMADYLVVNGRTIIKTIPASDVTYNGISEFMGAEGTPILIGERRVNESSAIAVVYNLEGTTPATEEDVMVVQEILNNTRSDKKITTLTLFGVNANPDWAEDLVMTEKALQLIKGESSVYVSPYTSTFAEGTTNTLTAGSISLSYSDNIKDTSTGYAPYIYEFPANQNGTVNSSSSKTNTLRAKFLAQSNMTMKDIFQ